MARAKQYSSNAEKQAAYRKRNAKTVNRNDQELEELERLYFVAIDAVRDLAAYCDEHQPNCNVTSMRANHYLNLIRRAAFDAESGGVYRRRAAGGMSNSSSPLDPQFDRQFKSRGLKIR